MAGAVTSGLHRRLCFPGRYYEYMFGQSLRRNWGYRPFGPRAEAELSHLQVVIESRDPGCDSHPHLGSSEACEYRILGSGHRICSRCLSVMSPT